MLLVLFLPSTRSVAQGPNAPTPDPPPHRKAGRDEDKPVLTWQVGGEPQPKNEGGGEADNHHRRREARVDSPSHLLLTLFSRLCFFFLHFLCSDCVCLLLSLLFSAQHPTDARHPNAPTLDPSPHREAGRGDRRAEGRKGEPSEGETHRREGKG